MQLISVMLIRDESGGKTNHFIRELFKTKRFTNEILRELKSGYSVRGTQERQKVTEEKILKW